MAEEEKKKEAPAAAAAAPAKKGGDKAQTVGKFIHGDHMCHILFEKGKKFVSSCEDDR